MTVLAGPSRVRSAGTWRPQGRGAGPAGPDPAGPVGGAGRDTEARARYYRKVYWRGPGQCAFLVGALARAGLGCSGPAPSRRSLADQPAWSLRRTPTTMY